MIYACLTIYALITLLISMQAGKALQAYPQTSGAVWVVLAILAWPLFAVVGFVAYISGWRPPVSQSGAIERMYSRMQGKS
jgi:hypothetical protein